MLNEPRLPATVDVQASTSLECYLGNNIRRTRTRKGTSLAELGLAIGIEEASIANYEAGLEKVSPAVLYRIATTLDVTLGSLFGIPGP